MPTWVLDDGPLDHLARFARLADLPNWPQGQLFVAEQTVLDASQSPARNALLSAKPSPFQSFRIMMGTAAADIVHNHLRRQQRHDEPGRASVNRVDSRRASKRHSRRRGSEGGDSGSGRVGVWSRGAFP